MEWSSVGMRCKGCPKNRRRKRLKVIKSEELDRKAWYEIVQETKTQKEL